MMSIHEQDVLSYARFKGPIRAGFSASSTRIGLFTIRIWLQLASNVVDLLLVYRECTRFAFFANDLKGGSNYRDKLLQSVFGGPRIDTHVTYQVH